MGSLRIAVILVGAFLIDCIIGDPHNPFHPIRLVGVAVTQGVKCFKKPNPRKPAMQFFMGMLLTLLVVGISYFLAFALTRSAYCLSFFFGIFVETVICYFLIAPKALKDESMKVHKSLVSGDIENARMFLSRIVGRDTQTLNTASIVRACVETISENLSDGVIAPSLFIAIGGAPLAMAYKAINTLDSMIGYRNEEFLHFGKFAARLDDAVNYIPSRLSALLMMLGCFFVGADVAGAWRIFCRDRHNHDSPNSAQTESVCAGALGICLGGDSQYNGITVKRQIIGDNANEPLPEHIIQANRLMYASTILAIALLSILVVHFQNSYTNLAAAFPVCLR